MSDIQYSRGMYSQAAIFEPCHTTEYAWKMNVAYAIGAAGHSICCH